MPFDFAERSRKSILRGLGVVLGRRWGQYIVAFDVLARKWRSIVLRHKMMGAWSRPRWISNETEAAQHRIRRLLRFRPPSLDFKRD